MPGVRSALVLLVLVAGSGGVRAACDATGRDAEALAVARHAIAAACPCDGFASHSAYVRCAGEVVAAEVAATRLPSACRSVARRIARNSTCSFATPRVACCRENAARKRSCRPTSPERCAGGTTTIRTPCAGVTFCADTPCGERDLGVRPARCPARELLHITEGNRLRRLDVASIDAPPLAEDVLVERASLDPIRGRDVNGQMCPLPDGSGRFVAGEDTGQPTPPPGWGVFAADGTQVGKLTATYYLAGAEPFGCAFDAGGRLFTTEVGNQASGPFTGQLVMWFPPYDGYPAGNAPSTNFCKLAVDLGTAGSVALDERGRVYVAAARAGVLYRFSPPFPTGPDAAGGCDGTDALGSPMATNVAREVFVAEGDTWTGITRSPRGGWFVGSVFLGSIYEYDAAGLRLRAVAAPASGETTFPLSAGHPQGLATDCAGDLFYADLDLRVSPDRIGPGPNGSVRRVRFDACGAPGAPEVVRDGLAFPDGVAIVPGSLQP